MKVTRVGVNGYQLRRFAFVNCYLVREEDGFTLIDTGLGSSSGRQILAASATLGGEVRRVLLTHAHGDHVGSVDALLELSGSTKPELVSNLRSLPLLRNPPDKTLQSGEPAEKIKGSLPGIDSRPSKLLNEGDRVGSLLCIETPGHIPGHLSFLDERDGTLYAGDALVGKGRLAVSGFAPWYFPLPNFATWNRSVALASAEKLLTFPVMRFACGHGALQPGGVEALRAALAKARK